MATTLEQYWTDEVARLDTRITAQKAEVKTQRDALGVAQTAQRDIAKAVQTDKEPIVISVDQGGKLYLTLGAAQKESIDADTLVKKVSAFVRQNPQVPVLIAGDLRASYGEVYEILPALQQAGVAKVGLMSQPVQGPNNQGPNK